MKHALIVDNDGESLASDFVAIATRLGLQIQFSALDTPEILLQELRESIPDFILLHHTWQGLKIGKLLENIRERAPSTHVVVFTGQSVKIDELIECVRGGVADYWRKGELDNETMVRKIAMDIEDGSLTIGKLHLSSGSVRKLLTKAEQLNREAVDTARRYQELETRVRGGQPQVLPDVMDVARYVLKLGALTVSVIFIDHNTHLHSWEAVAVVALIAVVILFLEGAIKYALLKINRDGLSLEGRTDSVVAPKRPK